MKKIIFVPVVLVIFLVICAGCTSTPSSPSSGTPVSPSGSVPSQVPSPLLSVTATGTTPPAVQTTPGPSPDSVKWSSQGFALLNSGKYQDSLQAFDKAISSDPNNIDAWNGKGNTLFNLELNDEAMAAFDKAISINANYPHAYIGKGNILFNLGKNDEAMVAFDKAISLNPNIAPAWNGKGDVLLKLGKTSEATEAFNKARSIDLNNNKAQVSTDKGSGLSSPHIISGYVYDGSFPYGTKKGISGAVVTYGNVNTVSDTSGFFNFSIVSGSDPELTISAPGFHNYKETPSRMVNGGFHLIPDSVYRGVYLVVWDPQKHNEQNYMREWNKQTLFVIVQKGASTEQLNDLVTILKTDKYRNMTGGRFSSAAPPMIVDEKPAGFDREGKTIISISPGIVPGGIAHSASFDGSGVINYAEITWDTGQQIDPTCVWHEMVHTVTSGGHINEWPSVVSEIENQGIITSTDEKIFNCIYNSPPRRSN